MFVTANNNSQHLYGCLAQSLTYVEVCRAVPWLFLELPGLIQFLECVWLFSMAGLLFVVYASVDNGLLEIIPPNI